MRFGNATPSIPEGARRIREKYREIFGADITMTDHALIQRYRITADGDLIVVIR